MNLQLLITPLDHGPVYRETTDLSRFIVEPWNAFSSLTFWIPVLIFLWQLSGRYRQHAFVVYFCIPMLMLGGLGSTLFHAFRSSGWLLLMDVLPILLLVLGVSIRMWLRVLPKKWLIAPVLGVFFGLNYLVINGFNGQDQINAGYLIRGSMLLLPCLLFLLRTDFRDSRLLGMAGFCLLLALVFRFADDKITFDFMPWGTHWLWHISTSLGAYFLGAYLIRINETDT